MSGKGVARAMVAVAAMPWAVSAASAAEQPPAAWARCAACHSVAAGKPGGIGPSLVGVVGRKAASRPGYAYSPALKASGVTWTPANLDAFIAKPQALVPGNRMMFVGLPDAKARAEIVRFLQGVR